LLSVKNGDFFPLFWRAWVTSFKEEAILKFFEATGIWLKDREVILERLTYNTKDPNSWKSPASVLSREDWLKIRTLVKASVKDDRSQEAKKLNRSLHHLSAQDDLLHYEIKGLKEALLTKKKHKKHSKLLDLQQRQEYHDRAVVWSLGKLREACTR
jgi:hypothetical protein